MMSRDNLSHPWVWDIAVETHIRVADVMLELQYVVAQ